MMTEMIRCAECERVMTREFYAYGHDCERETADHDECLWCGRGGCDVVLTWRKPYPNEPGHWCCPDCTENRPWK